MCGQFSTGKVENVSVQCLGCRLGRDKVQIMEKMCTSNIQRAGRLFRIAVNVLGNYLRVTCIIQGEGDKRVRRLSAST